MNDSDLNELGKKKAELLANMTEYMNTAREGFNAGYTAGDINACDNILVEFTGSLQKLRPDVAQSDILECVKSVVLALNQLNSKVNGSLIETMEREDLCDYIGFAANRSGLENVDYDVTEEWREW